MRTAKWCGPGAPKAGAQVGDNAKAHCAGDGGNRQGSPRRAPISRKPSRREGRCDHRRTLRFSRSRNFFLRESPGCRRPPGLPCALCSLGGQCMQQSSGEFRRENASSCLSAVVLAKARTHTAESLFGARWQTFFARTAPWGYGSWLSPGRQRHLTPSQAAPQAQGRCHRSAGRRRNVRGLACRANRPRAGPRRARSGQGLRERW